MKINCVERVLIGTADLAAARERWSGAGFALAPDAAGAEGIEFARMAAGGVEIDLCAAESDAIGPLAEAIRNAAARGGATLGWIWGVASQDSSGETITLPAGDGAIAQARMLPEEPDAQLPGVFTATIEVAASIEARRQNLARFGANANTVGYLEHIVVMTPVLDDAIAAHEAIGVPCKRIREVGNGARQAFFDSSRLFWRWSVPRAARPDAGDSHSCAPISDAQLRWRAQPGCRRRNPNPRFRAAGSRGLSIL